MKKLLSYALAFTAMIALSAAKGDKPMLEIGAKAPLTDLKMENVDGKMLSLDKLKGENGLLVIFSCNTCPFVIGWEDQYPGLADFAAEQNIGMVLVNSNEKKREGDDSMAEMQKHYKEAGYKSPYVIDANHKLADAFGARTTPHVYLLNSEMNLVYRGSINDKYERKDKTAQKQYLREAMEALAQGEEIANPNTREIGCSIKRI